MTRPRFQIDLKSALFLFLLVIVTIGSIAMRYQDRQKIKALEVEVYSLETRARIAAQITSLELDMAERGSMYGPSHPMIQSLDVQIKELKEMQRLEFETDGNGNSRAVIPSP